MALDIVRRFVNGAWKTEAAETGGGGSLPASWTQSADGQIVGQTDGVDVEAIPLILRAAAGQTDNTTSLIQLEDEDGFRLGDWDAAGDFQLQLSKHNAQMQMTYGDGNQARNGHFKILCDSFEPYVEWQLPHTGGPGLYSSFFVGTSEAPQTFWVRSDEAGNTGLSFFGATPVAQQTGVAVSAAAVHAALVNLGLITA